MFLSSQLSSVSPSPYDFSEDKISVSHQDERCCLDEEECEDRTNRTRVRNVQIKKLDVIDERCTKTDETLLDDIVTELVEEWWAGTHTQQGLWKDVRALKTRADNRGPRASNWMALWDSGSNADLCDDINLFESGSMRRCNVEIAGVNGDAKELKATLCGDIKYEIEGVVFYRRRVLFVPDAMLAEEEVNEPTLLLGVKKFIKENKMGVTMTADGEKLEIISPDKTVVCSFKSISHDLYIHKIDHNKQYQSRREKTKHKIKLKNKTFSR
jgi:hypothetical protein